MSTPRCNDCGRFIGDKVTCVCEKPSKPTLKRLFWDIETSPNLALVWRAGYKQNVPHDNIVQERAIICICYKWEGEGKIHALTWDDGDDYDMLRQFIEIVNEADELVAHFGDRFDLKWFQGRCLYHDFDPLPEYKTVDTCVIAKRRFYLNSTKLDYLGKLLFDEGKSEAPFQWWKDITLYNDQDSLKKMVQYCKRDVELVERVYEKLIAFHKHKSHAGVMAGGPKWSCSYCGSEDVRKSKTRTTAKGTVQHQMRCGECLRYYTISNRSFEQYMDID